MNNTMIEEIHSAFSSHLSEFGEIYIAGGAARDVMMGKEPKDYDIFVLTPTPYDEVKPLIDFKLGEMAEAKVIGALVDWHKSEPFWINNIEFMGKKIQVLASPYSDIGELVGSFDWNVCMFAYGMVPEPVGLCDFLTFGTKIEDIGVGKDLKLNKITFPLSTLRRGFRFSERFQMKLPYEELDKILDELQKIRNEKTKGLIEAI
jgi:hypothetical protein